LDCFSGDIIVILYLLMIPSVVYMLGASASGNVVAGLGVSREMKLMLSYELPLVTSVLVPVIKSSSIRISDIMTFSSKQPVILSFSGVIAFFVMIICFQAKLGLVPFDMAEAEQELAGGILIEYSGILLGIIKLTKQILYSIVPLFLILMFFPADKLLSWVVRYLLVLLLFILIRNTNPRLKIDQSINFFWKIIFPISLVGVLLAMKGL
ncbi:MAG: complex I subunit 1 family protein, partial [Bacteroidales bacterium]